MVLIVLVFVEEGNDCPSRLLVRLDWDDIEVNGCIFLVNLGSVEQRANIELDYLLVD